MFPKYLVYFSNDTSIFMYTKNFQSSISICCELCVYKLSIVRCKDGVGGGGERVHIQFFSYYIEVVRES